MASSRWCWAAAICSILAGCGGSDDAQERTLDPAGSASTLRSDCGRQVVRRGDSFDVFPSGGEDTGSLQCALDNARAGTVRLAAGTFRIAQIVSVGFVGKIQGAGAEATMVTNVDRPLEVVAVDFNLAPPSADRPWPTLLAFVGGDFSVSDLAIKVSGSDPTREFSAFGFRFTLVAHAISITGDRARATIERVHFQGEDSPGNPFGVNLLNAVDVEGVTGTDPPPLAVDLTVRDSSFLHLGSGVPVSNLRSSNVRIVGNVFREMLLGSEIVDHTDSTYLFTDNEVHASLAGIDQYDVCLGPSSSCGMLRSRVTISGNRFFGAPVVLEGTWRAGTRCRLVKNGFAGMSGIQLLLGPETRDCFATGVTKFVDEGIGNRVLP